ncbi:MAG: hypothetical protein IJ424_08185 [Oscillospiraceae bacterium]|nr:hypothetical protein [Oscillospiraceae bacterium]
MRSLLRKSFVAIILVVVVISLTACIPTDEAKTQVAEFLSCLSEGDYESAEEYMHPDSPINAEYLQAFVEESQKAGADLSQGIDKISYNNIQTSYYHSDVDGKRLVLGGEVTLLDGTSFELSIEFVDNDGGYGISQFSATYSNPI